MSKQKIKPDDVSRAELDVLLAAEPDLLARVVRTLRTTVRPGSVVRDPQGGAALFRPRLAHLVHEELHAAAFDSRMRLIAVETMTKGCSGFTIVEPKQILRWALRLDTEPRSIMIAHNHPSGDPEPSPQDREVTEHLARAARAVGLVLVDHLVIAGLETSSFAERGELPHRYLPSFPVTS